MGREELNKVNDELCPECGHILSFAINRFEQCYVWSCINILCSKFGVTQKKVDVKEVQNLR